MAHCGSTGRGCFTGRHHACLLTASTLVDSQFSQIAYPGSVRRFQFTRLPSDDPEPARTAFLPAKARAGKHALLEWLSDFRLESTPKRSNGSRLILLPALAVALVVSTTVVACGTEETTSPPTEQRQVAQTTDRASPRSSGSSSQDAGGNQSTPVNDQPSAGPGASTRSDTPAASATASASAQTTPAAREQTEQPSPSAEDMRRAQYLYAEAELHLLHRRFHQAAHTLDQAIVADPELAEAYALRGFARTMTRDYDAAMADFDNALATDTENVSRAYAFRSYAHSELGDYEAALADAEHALETAGRDDPFAAVDAELAKFTAQYRSGDYGAINENLLRSLPQGSTHELNQGLTPYGLTKLYEYVDLNGNVNALREAENTLLLDPDDFNALQARQRAYHQLRWHDKATADLNRMIEGKDGGHLAKLHVQRAREWAEAGDYAAIAAHAGDLNPSRSVESAILLAVAHWRNGDLAAAGTALDAMDYGDPAALYGWEEGQYPTSASDLRSGATAALALKGALLAAQGNLEEGLRYLNMPTCVDRIDAAADSPLTGETVSEGQRAMDAFAERMASSWLGGLQHGSQWADEATAQAVWEWCGYPDEFVADPLAGLLATADTPALSRQPAAPFPTRVSYRIKAGALDPVVTMSENPDLHLYLAAWAQLGLPGTTALDVMRDVDQAIELGTEHPDAQRMKAEAHLAWAAGHNPVAQPEAADDRQEWLKRHHDQATDAYAVYEAEAAPERWEAARYHFARGRTLGWLEQTQEAQAAYQQAFQNGFDEAVVKKALNELSR